jgi:hypothetical protein
MSDEQQIIDPVPLDTQFADAAAAMKAMRAGVQPRDDGGRFAGEQVSEPEDAPPLADATTEGEEEYDAEEYEADGSDEDQPEAVEMPKSWSKEDADLWRNLPPEAQAKIAVREGQRDAAITTKFQEAAEARRAYEAKIAEANANRDKWAQDYDLLVADLSLPKPDPRQYGLGTGNYNREAYDIALVQWEEGNQQLQTLRQQREAIRAQQEQDELQGWNAKKEAIEAVAKPQLLALLPELADPVKGGPVLQGLIDWGIAQGLPPETFAPENHAFITSAELRILALAKKAADAEGTAKTVPPKKQPAVRPGVSTPRSAQKTVMKQKAMQRLQNDNSIEAAVAAMRALRQ